MVLLGEASYAFYLVHLPGDRGCSAPASGARPTPSIVALEALNLAVVIFLAIGLHVAIERPARRWIRARLWRPARPPFPAAAEAAPSRSSAG